MINHTEQNQITQDNIRRDAVLYREEQMSRLETKLNAILLMMVAHDNETNVKFEELKNWTA